MNDRKIVLGSKSPRRSEILSQVGISYVVIPSRKEEIISKVKPSDIVMELSLEKALDVKEQINEDEKYFDSIILCADTMVAYKNDVLGKPKSDEDAKRMLQMIQGEKTSCVHRGDHDWKKRWERKNRDFLLRYESIYESHV